MNVTDERTVPHDLEAEKAVLGAVLLDNERLSDACELLTAPQFFRAGHRRLFEAMLALSERREAIDVLTLRNELGGDLQRLVGGAVYLSTLIDGVPHGMNVVHYAKIVREKASLRALIEAGTEMIQRAYDAQDDAETVLESAERTILGLAAGRPSEGFESLGAIAPRAMALLERMHATRGGVSGVPSGFTDLDALTRGFQPGTLIVLGARPGVGKTSFALNTAAHAVSVGRRVGFFSLEMPNEELFIRLIASLTRIDSHRLQSGYIGERDWGRIGEAIATLADAPMLSDETPAIGIFQVRSRARKAQAEHGIDLLVLDYLQLMSTGDRYDSRALEVGALTAALKSFAKELKVPILLLSQLSREHEKRGDRPRLSDLRDSGSIEQDADIVMFLYRRDDPEVLPSGGTLAELIIAKHRNGPTGTIKLSWNDQYTRFDDVSDAPAEPADRQLPIGDR